LWKVSSDGSRSREVERPPVVEAEKVEPSPVVEPHRLLKKSIRDEQPGVEPPPVVKSLVVEG
jgi:hypothetical protein